MTSSLHACEDGTSSLGNRTFFIYGIVWWSFGSVGSQFWSFDSQNIKSYRVFKIGVPTSHCTPHCNISQNILLESFDGRLIGLIVKIIASINFPKQCPRTLFAFAITHLRLRGSIRRKIWKRRLTTMKSLYIWTVHSYIIGLFYIFPSSDSNWKCK